MINIAICDDEKYISDKVKKLALDFFHRKNVEIKISQFGLPARQLYFIL